MCKVLKVSKSGYYHWLKLSPFKRWFQNQILSLTIDDIFKDSFESYGSPRIKKELEKLGYDVSRPRVARIMKSKGLYARRRRNFKATTDSRHDYPIAPNILARNFRVTRKNQLWVSDITYIRTKQGWMYLSVIIDLFNRKIIGWAFSDNLSTSDTIIPAWEMALAKTTITKELIFHSDRGVQYASDKFTSLIKNYNGLIKQSMSRKGNCWDNGVTRRLERTSMVIKSHAA
jgi:transposase InsO family protein